MRALKKALMACAVVGALSAVMATSAFAATYSEGKVGVTTDLSTYKGDQMTVLVIAKGAEAGGIESSEILYIDQMEAPAEWKDASEDGATPSTKIFQGMGVRANYKTGDKDEEGNDIKGDGFLKNGDYVVKIGGTNVTEIIVEEFKVGGTERTIQLGECDGLTAAVNVNDALAVLEHAAGVKTLTGDALIAAECDGLTAAINVNDALAILEHAAGVKPLGTVTVYDE